MQKKLKYGRNGLLCILIFRLFKKAGILGEGNEEWRNIAEHTLVVNAAANWIAHKLLKAHIHVEIDLVDITSMLHEALRLNKEKIPKDAEIYDKWYRYYSRVETKLFGMLKEVFPNDLNNESVYMFVQSSVSQS